MQPYKFVWCPCNLGIASGRRRSGVEHERMLVGERSLWRIFPVKNSDA